MRASTRVLLADTILVAFAFLCLVVGGATLMQGLGNYRSSEAPSSPGR